VAFGQQVHSILIVAISFFWSCLKDQVYNSSRRTEKLKEDIRGNIANITTEKLQRIKQTSSAGARNVYVRGTAFATPPVICEL
jgi:hypothetical protein